MTGPIPSRPTGARGFALIWGGQVVSLLGTAMTRFALMVWGWEETGRATTLALLLFFQVGATLVLSPLAGVLVDRFDRRWVMIVSDLAAGLPTLALLALYLTGGLELWHVYAAAALSGGAESFQLPAYTASVTLLVPKRHYARASGLTSFGDSASRVFGPPLAAVLLPWVGLTGVLVFDAVTFLVAVGALLVVGVPPPPPSADGRAAGGFWRQTLFGLRYILARRGLLWLQLALALINFLVYIGPVLRAPMVLARTGGDELALGGVMAAAGAGGLIGGLLLAAWGGIRRRVAGALVAAALAGAGNVLLGGGGGIWPWAAGAFCFTFFLVLTNGHTQAFWQSKVPPDVQGRVFSFRVLVAQFSVLPALLLAGPAADRLFEPAMAAGGTLAPTLAPLFGTGTGAGMAVLIAVTGALAVIVAAAALALRPIREVEDALPDHAAAG